MTLRQLEMLKAIVETGRFTSAAQRLYVAQPSISQQIHLLEEELGAKLFLRRKNRKLVLTEAGQILKGHADIILRHCQTAQMEVSALTEEPVGQIRLGIGGHQLTSALPPALSAFHGLYPKVRIDLVNGTTPQLTEMLRANQLDLAVVNLPIAVRELRTQLLFTEQMVLAVPRKHKFARKREVNALEMAALPLVLYDQTTSMRQRLDAYFKDLGVAPNVLFELSSVEAMKRMVEAGLGATVIPASATLSDSKSKRLAILRISGRPLTRSVGVALALLPRLPNVVEEMAKLISGRFQEIAISLDRQGLQG